MSLSYNRGENTIIQCRFWRVRKTATSIHLITYLLTPWSRVLLQKLTDPHLVKKYPKFYETRRSITALTNARHSPYSEVKS
jgi:hypothetical protein